MDSQEARIYLAIIITVIVLGIIISYFAISIIRQQRRNIKLQKANILAEISAMERERSRIANDLHDDLGPILSVIKFQVDHIEGSDEDEKKYLANASEHLDGLIGRMRVIANNLMPSALLRKGLIAALREFVGKISDSKPAVLIELTSIDELQLSEEKSINIYRVIQEIVHNCLKHSQADRLEIKISRTNEKLVIVCKDNGKGFDHAKQMRESGGLGLQSIKNRTEITGGILTVESKVDKGQPLCWKYRFNF